MSAAVEPHVAAVDTVAENETIRNDRERVRNLVRQDRQTGLATAFGVDIPDVAKPEELA